MTDYQVTYEPGTANAPPQVGSFDVLGLDAFNEVHGGLVLAFGYVDHAAADVDDFEVYFGPSGSTDGTPFEAPVLVEFGGLHRVFVPAFDYSGTLNPAISAVDNAGKGVETTTFDTLTIRSGAGG